MESESWKGRQESHSSNKLDELTMYKALYQIPWVKEGEQDQVSALAEARLLILSSPP